MPRSDPDDPYRDESKRHAPRGSRGSPRSHGKPRAKSAPQKKTTGRKQASAKSAQHKPAKSRSEPRHKPTRAAAVEPTPAKPRKRRSSRGGRGGGSQRESQLTSHPTSRNAYVETRAWLLAEHGPVCAYCARSFTPRVMTLDHVAPRKGKTAYDRRDNLVLACPACNAAKRDLAPIAFLLGSRDRAANLLRYGTHLSPMLVEMARSLAPAGSVPVPPPLFGSWAALLDVDDEDPYRS
ncbi:MAG TPA: HNH endonuclease signature motif containing protein [Gemmatimonadaceae bacterium]|nr:HNH endonuclease signature motif containing protein [Gemmatimonadaceae bacterium]